MRRLAVIGQPVGHSRSPAIHTAALVEMGLGDEWSYEAIELAPDEFEARVRAMPAAGFAGVNVTVPHKVAALALADRQTAAAREIGAANTLSFLDDGIEADNTDAAGFVAALPGNPRGREALVLGAGGSARAVVWALTSHGATVSIWNRTPDRALALAAEFGGTHVPGDDEALPGSAELIVNCTTVGMGDGGPGLKALPLEADSLSEKHLVVDLAYGSTETELARAARARGAVVVDGLEVLVHQGAASLRIWTGFDPPIETMMRAARTAHADREPTPVSDARPRPGRGDGSPPRRRG